MSEVTQKTAVAEAAGTTTRGTARAQDANRKTILIVDDDQDVRNLHALRLSDVYNVVQTEDPEEALGLALEHKPAAILLDLMMPRLSGFELCQTLHALSYTSLIPIFVISGESANKYRAHCESLGATAYFEKPVDYKALKARLGQELRVTPSDRRAEVRLNMRVVLAETARCGRGRKTIRADHGDRKRKPFGIPLPLLGFAQARHADRSLPRYRYRALRWARQACAHRIPRRAVAALRFPIHRNQRRLDPARDVGRYSAVINASYWS
jgi:DNA-binding response OmpR family regulator